MNFDKLLEFLSDQHKGFLVSFVVIFPIAYTILFLYVDVYRNFDFADKLIFAATADILYHSLFFTITFIFNHRYYDQIVTYTSAAVCGISSGSCITMSFAFNNWHLLLPLIYTIIPIFIYAIAVRTSNSPTKPNDKEDPTDED